MEQRPTWGNKGTRGNGHQPKRRETAGKEEERRGTTGNDGKRQETAGKEEEQWGTMGNEGERQETAGNSRQTTGEGRYFAFSYQTHNGPFSPASELVVFCLNLGYPHFRHDTNFTNPFKAASVSVRLPVRSNTTEVLPVGTVTVLPTSAVGAPV